MQTIPNSGIINIDQLQEKIISRGGALARIQITVQDDEGNNINVSQKDNTYSRTHPKTNMMIRIIATLQKEDIIIQLGKSLLIEKEGNYGEIIPLITQLRNTVEMENNNKQKSVKAIDVT